MYMVLWGVFFLLLLPNNNLGGGKKAFLRLVLVREVLSLTLWSDNTTIFWQRGKIVLGYFSNLFV